MTDARPVPRSATSATPATSEGTSDTPVVVLDCRGQRCPLPVIALARQITEVSPGEVIEVIADDPAARVDIPAWCRLRGASYLGESIVNGAPAFTVQRLQQKPAVAHPRQ